SSESKGWNGESREEEGSAGEMTKLLVPHTSEWFEDLMLRDVQQAMHTGAIIQAAGREDVCSICGDDPAKDYNARSGAGFVTLRLCADCLMIRAAQHGDYFVPIGDPE